MSDNEQGGVTGKITIQGETVAICGTPSPQGPAAMLCGFGPGHPGRHSWESEDRPAESADMITIPRGDFSVLLAAASALTGSGPVPELLRPLVGEVLARYKVRLEVTP